MIDMEDNKDAIYKLIDELKKRYPNGAKFVDIDELKKNNADLIEQIQFAEDNYKNVFDIQLKTYLCSIGIINPKILKEEKRKVINKADNNTKNNTITSNKRKTTNIKTNTRTKEVKSGLYVIGKIKMFAKVENDQIVLSDYGTDDYSKISNSSIELKIPDIVFGLPVVKIELNPKWIRITKKIYVPKSVKRIWFSWTGDKSHGNYDNIKLKQIEIDNDNPYLSTDGKVLYNKEKTILYDCIYKKLTSYEIPEGVKEIDEYAFYNCKKLKTITISNSVKKINANAFRKCIELEDITIPQNVKVISRFAFAGCKKLERITIPNGVTSIESFAFQDCTNLKEISLPNSLNKISSYLFENCEKIEKITIPEGVTLIEDGAFRSCRKLKEVSLPDSLKEIQEYAFECREGLELKYSNKMKLDKIEINPMYNKENIGNVFWKCKNLDAHSYIVPEGITELHRKCFSDCENLTEVKLPSTLERIDDFAFYGCISLKQIVIPKNVKEIGIDAFPRTYMTYKSGNINEEVLKESVFETIEVEHENQFFTVIDGTLYSKDETILYWVNSNYKNETFIVPQKVKEIKKYAFKNCDNINRIIFKGNVEFFEEDAFKYCNSLEEVIFSDTQEKIQTKENDNKYGIFTNCKKLSKVKLSPSIKVIGKKAFYNCGIKEIDLPEGLCEIGDEAFANNYIEEVTIPKTVHKIGRSIFAREYDNDYNIENQKLQIHIYETIESEQSKFCVKRFARNPLHLKSYIGLLGVPEFSYGSLGEDMAKWSEFNIIVHSVKDNTVKFEVLMPSSLYKSRHFEYVNCWGKNANFEFEKVKKYLPKQQHNTISKESFIKLESKYNIENISKEDLSITEHGYGTKNIKFTEGWSSTIYIRGIDEDITSVAKEYKKEASEKRKVYDEIYEIAINPNFTYSKAKLIELIHKYPQTKIVAFFIPSGQFGVYEIYSESGYPYITEAAHVGEVFRQNASQWFNEYSVFDEVDLYEENIQTGDKCYVYHEFKYEKQWNAINYVFKIEDELKRIIKK